MPASTVPTASVDAGRAAGGGSSPAGLRAWLLSALRDVAYCLAVFAWSIVAFTVLVTGVSVVASLLVLVVGVFGWIAFVYAMRWTTFVDRCLAGWQRGRPVRASYRRSTDPGFVAFVKNLTTDPQTWRDLAWMAVTSFVGFGAGVAVVTVAGVAGSYLSMPLWYWAIDDPTSQYGLTNVGLFEVDSLGRAAVMSVVGLVLVPLALLLARACAGLHSRLAVALLDR